MKRNIRTPFFVVNPKAYLYGEGSLALALEADKLAEEYDVDIFFTAQACDLSLIAKATKRLIVTAQHMDGIKAGKGMGSVLPEAIKNAGAEATFLNHAEHSMSMGELVRAVKRARDLDILVLVCADSAEEARAIRFVAARGIMNGVGDGAFAPDAPMTRGMIATVLYRMERKPAVTGGTVFADVSAGQWYSDAIAWASASGIVQGYGESFGVNDALTKEQLIVMLWRLAGKPAATAVESDAHDWAAEAVSWAVSVGLIDRDSVGADISAPAARGQVAVLIERFINLG